MTLSEGLADLGSALGALQKASDILKAWASLATDKERAAKLSELNGQILAAQTSAIQANAAQASLIEEIGKLKEQITQFETWDAEKIRYKLYRIYERAFAYALKQEAAAGEPPHWFCTNCYQNRQKSVLQYKQQGPLGRNFHSSVWACLKCDAQILCSSRYISKIP